MLINYFRTAFRFVIKNISFTIINLLGLATGITAFLLITLYLQDQMGYDRHIPDNDRLYRLVGMQEPAGLDVQHVSFTSAVWGNFIRENIPQVEDVFRIMYPRSDIAETGNQSFRINHTYFSEGNVLQRMGYSLISGNYNDSLLSMPGQAVVSLEVARRLFSEDQPVGRTFKVDEEIYQITGVFDNSSIKSHLELEMLLSLATIESQDPYLQMPGNNTLTTYILLQPGTDPSQVEEVINQQQQLFSEESPDMMKNTFYLQPVKDIFLRSGGLKFHMRSHQGSITNVYIFSVVAFLILVIACINYINLATANSTKRAREVGMRKVLGAERRSLTLQFIGESMVITFLAILAAMGLTELVLPRYNAVLGTELTIDFSNLLFSAGLPLLLVVISLVSGFYPALYLSRFQAGAVLKAGNTSGKPQSARLRKVLVTVQFAISAAMILATIIVMQQVKHMHDKDLGYNENNVISVSVRQTGDYDVLRSFREKLLSFPEVVAAGIASGYNGVAGRQSTITTGDSVPVTLMVRYGYVDPDFFPTMEISIAQGRNFSFDYGTDPFQTMIINRAAQRALGWEQPIGKKVVNNDDEEYDYYTVIGVIEDYHYYSLRTPIEPAVYIWRPGEMRTINLRYQGEDATSLTEKIRQAHDEFFPGYYFSNQHLSQILSWQYQTEENSLNIFLWFALLCILISCLGLFGLTSFMVNQRKKEIGIRKVLGGTMMQINRMLLLSFLRWVFVASIVAIPITWLIMNRWLQNYAYSITIGLPHIIITLLIITVIASSTILAISTTAARQNPADTIKYE